MENQADSMSRELSATLEKNGFVTIKKIIDPLLAERAHREIEAWYARDLADRSARGTETHNHIGPAGLTVLTAPSHLMIDAYLKSPALDQIFETILTHPMSAKVIENLAGKNIKLRGYNIRRMTGAYDPAPAHEFHRDSYGEFGFSILLTDVGPGTDAATSFVRGSHLYPYCPRWNCLFPMIYRGLGIFLRLNIFNHILRRSIADRETSGYGERGDFTIFINDVWHGREPNSNGKQSMVVLIGAFPTEVPFPDKVVPPSPEILAQLPPHLRSAASCQLPPNTSKDTILYRMHRDRLPIGTMSLWRFAQVERKLADALSGFKAPMIRMALQIRYYLRRLFSRLGFTS